MIPSSAEEILELIRQRNLHWARMKRAFADCPLEIPVQTWLEQQWGLRPSMTADGMISDEYHIVDEKKYLMYLIKFG